MEQANRYNALVATSVTRPVMVTMIFLAILLIGLVSLTKLQTDMLPEIEPPVISVLTFYPGANASDVESDVTKYIEDQLSTVSNLDSITSISKDNLSVVSCKFEWGTDLDVAANDIRDVLDFAKNEVKVHAPDSVEPMVLKFSSSFAPIYITIITARESFSQLRHIASKMIADQLKRIPGVGAVIVDGGEKRQITIAVDHQVLHGYGISIMELSKILEGENINLPAGEIKMGKRAYQVRVPARFQSAEEIQNVIVAIRNGRPVYLKEVAQVDDAFAEPIEKAWTEGDRCLILMVQKQSGANTVDVVNKVRAKLDSLRKELPSDVGIHAVIDTAEDIEKSISNLTDSAYLGFIMVAVVTFLFLGSFRASLIIVITIPFSIILGVVFLFLKGYTINVISLMSFTIAVGMVVDNAIVALENITNHLEKGKDTIYASIMGCSEVGLALLASTLTTVVVFVPLIFVKGIAGIVFGQLGFVLSLTLIGSLLTAITMTPVMASKLFKNTSLAGGGHSQGGFMGTVLVIPHHFLTLLENIYESLLKFCLKNRALSFVIIAITALATLLLVPSIGSEFMPETDSGEINIIAELAEDSRLEASEDVAKQVEKIYSQYLKKEEKRNNYTVIGQSEKGFNTALGFKEGINIVSSGAKLVSAEKRNRSAKEIAHSIRQQMEKIPDIERFEVTAIGAYQKLFFGGGKQIAVEIMGHDLEQSAKLARQVQALIASIPGAVDVTISQNNPRSEVIVKIDRQKASLLGVNPAMAAAEIRANLYGYEATRFRDSGEDFKIFLRLKQSLRHDISRVEEICVPTALGTMVKLKNFASVEEEFGPIQIDRKNRERIIKVEASTWGRTLGEVSRDTREKLKTSQIPPGFEVKFGGEVKEQEEAFADMTLMMILGICLVYMVMAGQFESFMQPFIIMFSVPFAFVGVIWIFFLTKTPLSLMSFIGCILLVGIVVNNAIVLVDYTNLLRDQKMEFMKAIVEAGKRRLRPVFMTTITTVAGAIPMAISHSEGSEAWRPLAITIIGGLSVSTLVTLILVPLLYSLQKK